MASAASDDYLLEGGNNPTFEALITRHGFPSCLPDTYMSSVGSNDGNPYMLSQSELESIDERVRREGGRLLKSVRDTPISKISAWTGRGDTVTFEYVNRTTYISGYTFIETCLTNVK